MTRKFKLPCMVVVFFLASSVTSHEMVTLIPSLGDDATTSNTIQGNQKQFGSSLPISGSSMQFSNGLNSLPMQAAISSSTMPGQLGFSDTGTLGGVLPGTSFSSGMNMLGNQAMMSSNPMLSGQMSTSTLNGQSMMGQLPLMSGAGLGGAPMSCKANEVPVTVLGDATYCVIAPGCSGAGRQPTATGCPLMNSIAVSGCSARSLSYNPSLRTCTLHQQSSCQFVQSDNSWKCVLQDSQRQGATYGINWNSALTTHIDITLSLGLFILLLSNTL